MLSVNLGNKQAVLFSCVCNVVYVDGVSHSNDTKKQFGERDNAATYCNFNMNNHLRELILSPGMTANSYRPYSPMKFLLLIEGRKK